MLVKHKRKSSHPLLECFKLDQAEISLPQIYLDKKKTHKMSLKEVKSIKKMSNLTRNHLIKAKEEKYEFVKTTSPKISFKFLSPENKDNLKININTYKEEFSLLRSQKSIKTEPNIVFMSGQSKQTIVIPTKLIHMKPKSEKQIQPPDQNNEKKQIQYNQSFKTQKLKTFRNQLQERSTIVFQRQEIQLQTQKQSQIEFENSIVIKESSRGSRQNLQQKQDKDFHNSQKIEVAIKKWRKANTFTMSHQVFERKQKEKELHVSSNTEKIIKQDYKRGFLFQKVRKIDTKFYQADEQQSSSDRSQVIEDYKFLMSKIQVKGMEGSAFIQI